LRLLFLTAIRIWRGLNISNGMIPFSVTLQIRFLDLNSSGDLLKFIGSDNILMGVKIFIAGIVIIVAAIYMHLFLKKRQYFYTTSIKNNLQVWISNIILNESDDEIRLPSKFYRILNNSGARQFAIDELINCKRNFSGAVGTTVIKLYEELGLKKDSLKKIRNKRKWHVKAKGIQELYLMEQKDTLKQIYKNTNNQNEFVRMEAQIGIIHMTGFLGLRFLDVVSYPLTEWQQIKLLEQLRFTSLKGELTTQIAGWLLSENYTVVVFALKLIAEYQHLALQKNAIACLAHVDKNVRTEAIRTLIVLADESIPHVLVDHMQTENCTDRLMILDSLAVLATVEQEDYLLTLLDDQDNIIKLKAAIALSNCSADGAIKLAKKAALDTESFGRIFNHVKSVSRT
jgi:hypothetical protein